MMRLCQVLFFLALTISAASAMALSDDSSPAPPSSVAEYNAVKVHVMGGLVGFDVPAYQAVRSVASTMLAQGQIDHFVTETYGMDGGGVFCLQRARFTRTTLSEIAAPFKVIQADSVTTFYNVEMVEGCKIP